MNFAITIISDIINAIGWIILILLALDGLRNFIVYLNIIPRNNGKISNFIYSKTNKSIVQEVLIDLGYKKVIADNIVNRMSKHEMLSLMHLSPKICYRRLLKVIRECMVDTEKELQYRSGDTSASTSYYINTMMASQDNQMIINMSDLLIYLIKVIYSKNLDFIIVPKSGNPLLGSHIAKKINARCILYKDKDDASRANDPQVATGESCPELDLKINFEGANFLDRNKNLRGVVLDCNTSAGCKLIEVAQEFNKAITKANTNISKITDIFTLFRVDDMCKDIDAEFKYKGFKLHRFFDLNESLKQDIFKMQHEDIDCHSNKRQHIDDIIEKMNSSDLLRLNAHKPKAKSFLKSLFNS